MQCQSYCRQGRQPCPAPYACGVFNQRSGGASVDTELPAPTRPAERSTDFIEDLMHDSLVPSIVVLGGLAAVFIISALAAYLVRHA